MEEVWVVPCSEETHLRRMDLFLLVVVAAVAELSVLRTYVELEGKVETKVSLSKSESCHFLKNSL